MDDECVTGSAREHVACLCARLFDAYLQYYMSSYCPCV